MFSGRGHWSVLEFFKEKKRKRKVALPGRQSVPVTKRAGEQLRAGGGPLGQNPVRPRKSLFRGFVSI